MSKWKLRSTLAGPEGTGLVRRPLRGRPAVGGRRRRWRKPPPRRWGQRLRSSIRRSENLDAATGSVRATFRNRKYVVYSIAFSPDGKTLAAAGPGNDANGSVTLWDVATGRERFTLDADGGAYAVAFSPDGKVLATSEEASKLWDAENGRFLKKLSSSRSDGLAFSPDGKTLSTAGNLIELATGKVITSIQVAIMKSQQIRPMANSWPRERGPSGICRSAKSGATSRGTPRTIAAVAFAPNGNTLVTGNQDGTVIIWKIDYCRYICTLSVHTIVVTSVAFSPDGMTVASGDRDGTVKLLGSRQPMTTPFVSPSIHPPPFVTAILVVGFGPLRDPLIAQPGRFDAHGGDQVIHLPGGPPHDLMQGLRRHLVRRILILRPAAGTQRPTR